MLLDSENDERTGAKSAPVERERGDDRLPEPTVEEKIDSPPERRQGFTANEPGPLQDRDGDSTGETSAALRTRLTGECAAEKGAAILSYR